MSLHDPVIPTLADVQEISPLIRRLKEIESQLPLQLLRTEAFVLMLIKEDPGQPVKHYMINSGLSYRGFYNILRALIDAGLVRETIGGKDRRQRLLS
ncbi:MAG: hypothetical protein ACKOXK_06945 [Chakrabartia sp.]